MTQTGRVPPHDLSAEEAVLAAILDDSGELAGAVAVAPPEDYYSPANRRILEACIALDAARQPIDAVTVGGWLKTHGHFAETGGVPYLAKILNDTPAIANVAAYAEIVHDRARVRRVIATCQRIAADGHGEIGETQAWIDAVERDVAALAQGRPDDRMVSFGTASTEAYQRIKDAGDPERQHLVPRVLTGFRDLDATLTMEPGELVVFAARPGMGKTSFLLRVLTNYAGSQPGHETHHAMFASLEMQRVQIGIRDACAESFIDVGKARRGELTARDWQRLTSTIAHRQRLPLHIDDTGALTLAGLRAKVRRLKVALERRGGDVPHRLGVVAVDYLGLMKHEGKTINSRENEVAAISGGLKALAKSENVVVIALAQLNRAVESRTPKDRRPGLADLRDSGAIEQDADTIGFLYRDDYYDRESKARGVCEVILAKQRNGGPGRVELRFRSFCTRFEDVEQASEPITAPEDDHPLAGSGVRYGTAPSTPASYAAEYGGDA